MTSSSEEEEESEPFVVGTVQCLVVLDHVVILGVEPRVLQVVVQHRVVREDLRVELGWQLPPAPLKTVSTLELAAFMVPTSGNKDAWASATTHEPPAWHARVRAALQIRYLARCQKR